jgi:ribonuclease R
LPDSELPELATIAENISATERRAMLAERETADRLIAAYLADRIGAHFAARVSGITRSGLFVRLAETGADGFVPASSIGHEYYIHDEVRQAMVGEDTGMAYQLGDPVEVRLVEAIPTAGALRFEMLSEGRRIAGKSVRPRADRNRGRPQAARRGRRRR